MEILLKYNLINSLGLFIDVIGVVILFYNGDLLVESLQIINGDKRAAVRMGKKRKRSKFALFLLVIGFILQIVSNYI